MIRRAAPLLLLAALAGCAHSPPTRILTLDAVAPAAGAVRAGYRGPPVAVPAVHLPVAVDRLAYAGEPAAGRLAVDDFARWAAAPGLLARDALVRDLIARLPAGTVLPPGAARGPHARVVDVTVVALDLQPGGSTMQAAWRTLPGGPVRQAILSGPAAADPVGGARAWSARLGQLADRIAADVAG